MFISEISTVTSPSRSAQRHSHGENRALMVLRVVVEATNQSVANNTANYVEKRRSRLIRV